MLLDRRGHVRGVSVGTPHRIEIPPFDRSRAAAARLAGYRFIHTHPGGGGLDPDDLSDLALLRLDALAVLTLSPEGRPEKLEIGELQPPGAEGPSADFAGRITRTGLIPVHEAEGDFGRKIAELERQLSRRADLLVASEHERARERAMLLCLVTGSRAEAQIRLEELEALADTAGVAIVGTRLQRLRRPDPATLIGRGHVEGISIEALQRGASLLIFDRSLTPVQIKNLGGATDLKVIDRTQLILDIFAQHARSRDGKLQVELAQLKYRLPRLVGKNPALSRLAGGIGGQGPGETKLEIDRRRTRERITRLERELSRLEKHRSLGRKARLDPKVPLVSLVGYTNAGKSTLFNRLTRSSAVAEDQLFATLDPMTRKMFLGESKGDEPAWALASDTVGFIQNLPEELIRAFHATLEELRHADLLLHVVDAASPAWREQVLSVEKILEELGLSGLARLTVFNKADALGEEERSHAWPGLLLSAKTGEGIDTLQKNLQKSLEDIFRQKAAQKERSQPGGTPLARVAT